MHLTHPRLLAFVWWHLFGVWMICRQVSKKKDLNLEDIFKASLNGWFFTGIFLIAYSVCCLIYSYEGFNNKIIIKKRAKQ